MSSPSGRRRRNSRSVSSRAFLGSRNCSWSDVREGSAGHPRPRRTEEPRPQRNHAPRSFPAACPSPGCAKLAILLGGTTNASLLPRLSRAGRPASSCWIHQALRPRRARRPARAWTTLRLDWMRNVTSLPSLAGLARLDNVTLDTMKGLADLSPLVTAAPALRRTLPSPACRSSRPRTSAAPSAIPGSRSSGPAPAEQRERGSIRKRIVSAAVDRAVESWRHSVRARFAKRRVTRRPGAV